MIDQEIGKKRFGAPTRPYSVRNPVGIHVTVVWNRFQ